MNKPLDTEKLLDDCDLRKEETFYAVAEGEIKRTLRERYTSGNDIRQIVLDAAEEVFGSSDGVEVTVECGYLSVDHINVQYDVDVEKDCVVAKTIGTERWLTALLRSCCDHPEELDS
jgi:hypothetical protein